ncbi:hypothetical protein [Spongiibacter tropicus]|uniref:hypothetical protein n=1 Tax=Spongiibacter tropicus TaxID=454602 RepID=UPI0003B58970|nr:hypothetical protein [Spongiibacter tropicus]
MSIDPKEFEHWQSWVGKTERHEESLSIATLRRFAAATDANLDVEQQLPALAHWAFFLPLAGSRNIGPDGHPKRGGFVPPVSLPRRMFAAANMQFEAPLLLERPAALTATITNLKHRSGKSGELVLMDVEREVTQDGKRCVLEQQTIVFRDDGAPQPAIVPSATDAQPNEVLWTPNRVDLFRFSAVTFNSHRIHYDKPYAVNEEGYPDLVVHGPFTAVKLFAYAQQQLGAPLTQFNFRATAPLFVEQTVRLCHGGPRPDVAEGCHEFKALRCDGSTAMSAIVRID